MQLASLPTNVELKILFFWRVTSFALRAASLTFAEAMDFLIIVSASPLFLESSSVKASVANASQAIRASTLPNFVLV